MLIVLISCADPLMTEGLDRFDRNEYTKDHDAKHLNLRRLHEEDQREQALHMCAEVQVLHLHHCHIGMS